MTWPVNPDVLRQLAYERAKSAHLETVLAEMLAACQLIVAAERAATEDLHFELLVEAVEAAEAAIAKARGEEVAG